MQVIRRLLPIEYGLYEAHLLRLTPEDRASRFAGLVGDETVAGYVAHPDRLRAIIFGAFVDGELRGAAEVVRVERGWIVDGELAVTVEAAWQRRGIGSELVRRALVAARNRSMRCIHAVCIADNVRMQRIVRHFEGDLDVLHGMSEGAIELFGPTQLTVAEEAAGEATAWFATWMERILGPSEAVAPEETGAAS